MEKRLTMAVMIPTWRRPAQLARLLEALRDQERVPDEIVVACRREDAESIAVVDIWSHSSLFGSRHKLVLVEEPGHLPPLISGVSACEADIICQIDDDAIPRNDWLRYLEEDFRHEFVGGIGGMVVNHHDETSPPSTMEPGKLSWYGRSGKYGQTIVPGSVLYEADCLFGGNMAYRRDALLGSVDLVLNGGSAISYETDVALSVKAKGYTICYDPRVAIDHYPARRQIETMRGWNQSECFRYAHNLTYLCFKHLSWFGKAGFMIYFFIGGSWGCPGPGTYLLGICLGRNPSWKEQLIPAMKGRWAGLRSYLVSNKDTGEVTVADVAG